MADQKITIAPTGCYSVNHPDVTVSKGNNFTVELKRGYQVTWDGNHPGLIDKPPHPGNVGVDHTVTWGTGNVPEATYTYDVTRNGTPLPMCGGTGNKPSMTVGP